MDRWSVTTILNYLPAEQEVAIVLAKAKHLQDDQGKVLVERMVQLANLTRSAFRNGDLATVMSPRTVITWTENLKFFKDPALAFQLVFVNKCDPMERSLIAELYQRVFGEELLDEQA
jgi:cobaltochelatase CobS